MFLQCVVDWICRRREAHCQRWKVLAMNVIRNASDIFGGIGKYLVQELFFMAGNYSVGGFAFSQITRLMPPSILSLHLGLSLSLTEAEVFDNPSRVARFLMAYLQKIIENPSMW